MRAEYLIFNLAVIAGPLALTLLPGPTNMTHRLGAVAYALLASLPFLVWDLAVTDRHWWFNEAYTLPRIAGLPPGEWLYFITVPFACLYSWEMLFKPDNVNGSRLEARGWLYPLIWLLAPLGVWLFWIGREYTGLATLAFALVAALDFGGRRLLTHPRLPLFALFLAALILVFNGYLTGRPVVLYDEQYQLGIRIITIPLEDFVFGFAHVWLAVSLFEGAKLRARDGTSVDRGVLARAIEGRLGGYRHTLVAPNLDLPEHLHERTGAGASLPRVCVVGGGIAGMTTALHLADRGFRVTLKEAKDHLGGKLGSWPVQLKTGETVHTEHGFHAFFRHYYNFNRVLDRLAIRDTFQPTADYRILTTDRGDFGFANIAQTPALNLLSLPRTGLFRWREMLLNPKAQQMGVFLEYDEAQTFAAHDGTSFADFIERTGLPRNLGLVFNSFSRAFFADPSKMSLAELIKSFHFYYLSHNHGLLFDYPRDDHERTVLAPFRTEMQSKGVEIQLSTPVRDVTANPDGFVVDGQPYEWLVLACDVKGVKAIVESSMSIKASDPTLAAAVEQLKTSGRYAVLRLWADRDMDRDLPDFCVTDRHAALDSVSIYHRFEDESRDWATRHSGGVYELHSYHLPDGLVTDQQVRDALMEDFYRFFPELRGMTIHDEHLRVGADFTSFGVGEHAQRPGTRSAVPRLVMAGDWVRLPCPAMLMEAACTSGLYAVNEICAREGIRGELIESVPLRGLMRRAAP